MTARNLFSFIIVLLFITQWSGSAWSEESVGTDTRASASYTAIHAERDEGTEYRLRGEYRFLEKHLGLLEGRSLTRVFADGTRITDTGATLGVVSRLPKNVYIENDVFVAPNAIILPQYAVTTAPFISLAGNFDLGAIATFSHYRDEDVFTISPTILKTIEPTWLLGARANITRTYHDLLAFQAFAQRNFFDRFWIRGTVASGQAIESAGLESQFQSGAVDLRVRVLTGWFVNFGYVNYDSNIRKEQSLGVALEWVAK